MRIYLPSMEHAKRVSKRLHKEIPDKPLNLCQLAIARCFGYKDWHELEAVTGRQPPSLPDWLVPYDICQARREFQAERLISTPGMGIDIVMLSWARDVVERVQPSDFARQTGENTLEEDVFPSSWESEWIHDEERGKNGDIYLPRLQRAFDVIRTTGIISKANVGHPAAVIANLGDSFEKMRGDGYRCLAMKDDQHPDESKFDLLVLFTVQLVVRGGFVDQMFICIESVRGHHGISQGHLQHAACHLYDYLNCDRMHPAFDAEITSNPCGLLIGVSCEGRSPMATDLTNYVREVFQGRCEIDMDGGSVVDAYLHTGGNNEFPVRHVFDDTPQNLHGTSDDDRKEAHGESDLDPELDGFVEFMVDRMRLLAAYGEKMPQILAVFLRGRGFDDQADRILGTMEESADKSISLASIVNEARKDGALTEAESAFLIDWTREYLIEHTETIEQFRRLNLEDDDGSELDRELIASLRRLKSQWLVKYVRDGNYIRLVEEGQEAILGPLDQLPARHLVGDTQAE